MYKGRTSAKPGIVFGHENLGIVEEVISEVTDIKAGDRVIMPFNIGSGPLPKLRRTIYGFCTHVNPCFTCGAYGYVGRELYMGGQAEYLRVLCADFNALNYLMIIRMRRTLFFTY
jgi:glutathione-independent formaldehyde dehydrogenase